MTTSVVVRFFPHPLLVDRNPVCALEPLVVLDVVHPVLEVSVPLGQVNLQQVFKEVLQFCGEVRGKSDLKRRECIMDRATKRPWYYFPPLMLMSLPYPSRDNFLVYLNGLVGEEWRVSGGHLVHEHSQGPPVHGFVVALKANNWEKSLVVFVVVSLSSLSTSSRSSAHLTEDDLGREILWCPAEGPCPPLDALGEPEVGDLKKKKIAISLAAAFISV